MTRATEFLMGAPNPDGRTVETIVEADDDWLEDRHDWVQWAFPNQDASFFNDDAPVWTEDEARALPPRAVENLLRLTARFERFLARTDAWRARWDHNHRRITRVLHCLRDAGLHDRARALHRFVDDAQEPGESARRYWRAALPPTPAEHVSLADVASHVHRAVTPARDDARPYIGLEHIAQGEPRVLGHDRAGAARSAKSAFATGDLLLGKLRPNLRKAALAPFDGVCSTDILVLRAAEGITAEFLLAVVHTEAFWSFAEASAAGTRMPRTSWSALSGYRFALPPPAERARIADALTAMDVAIARNEAHLAQLRATRRALAEKLLGG